MSSETPPLTSAPSTSQSAQNLIEELLGPVGDDNSSTMSGDERARGDSELNGVDIKKVQDDTETPLATPNSTFYLTTNGELNEHSMAMPKPVVSPEAVLGRILEKTNEHLVAPKRVLEGSTELMRTRCVELEDVNAALRETVDKLQRGLLLARNQNEIL
ncbi:hypothetical protein TELCIR_13723 [Teladorsagia circumcincta]|uniref:Uncharacterized protein n=1 Tax=Teladorsagia circumcincta TaxID=45464 RepID=A0A2G9U554_TELCI|nr:hypothetical protein TELCIR_13723 [Teladorsagia circumcincta]